MSTLSIFVVLRSTTSSSSGTAPSPHWTTNPKEPLVTYPTEEAAFTAAVAAASAVVPTRYAGQQQPSMTIAFTDDRVYAMSRALPPKTKSWAAAQTTTTTFQVAEVLPPKN